MRTSSGLTKEILREFDVKLDISALIVVISWHSEMELLFDIKVDVVWVLLADKIEPRCICPSMSLFDWLLYCLFLPELLELRAIFESHQVTLGVLFFMVSFFLIGFSVG